MTRVLLSAHPKQTPTSFSAKELSECVEKTADKFTTEKTTFDMKEMKSRHAYDMLMQNLNAQIAQSEEDKNSKAEDKARSESETQWH